MFVAKVAKDTANFINETVNVMNDITLMEIGSKP